MSNLLKIEINPYNKISKHIEAIHKMETVLQEKEIYDADTKPKIETKFEPIP